MSTHDTRFLRDVSIPRRTGSNWTFAVRAATARYLSLVLSGMIAGLLYPAAIGWLFDAAPGRALLTVTVAIGGGLGVLSAILLGSGRSPDR